MAQYLLDTNILLRIMQQDSAQRQQAVDAVTSLWSTGNTLSVSPQVIVEFWCVATRPADVNGFGWTAEEASNQIDNILRQFPILEEGPQILPVWLELVRSNEVKGKKSHDARLVAIMLCNGADHLLTLDTDDFRSYSQISVVSPRDVTKAEI